MRALKGILVIDPKPSPGRDRATSPQWHSPAAASISSARQAFAQGVASLVDRFHETDHIRDVIPGRHRNVASPESIAPASGYGWIPGSRKSAPRNDTAYDSNFEIALLVALPPVQSRPTMPTIAGPDDDLARGRIAPANDSPRGCCPAVTRAARLSRYRSGLGGPAHP